MEKQLPIDTRLTREGALVLRALNNPFRQELVKIIHIKQRANVSSIYKKLKWEQSVAPQHLAILRRAGFVNTERDGKEIFYSLNYGRFELVDTLIKELVK